MTDPVGDLLNLLDIERLELDLFRGQSPDERASQRVFGGQVIAQSLVAAYRTVPEDRLCHSLHAYFIRPGDPKVPIIYQVDHARDGGSFTTRRVVAIQHGKQIFNMAASFQTNEDSWEHQHDMPDVPGPEGLKSLRERRVEIVDALPEAMREEFTRERDIEIREVEPLDLLRPEPSSDRHHVWFRVSRPVDVSPALHHCLLAYASDMNLLSSCYRPHGITWLHHRKLMSASLDHAMWLHGPIQFDEWHLYSMDSPFAGKGRGLNRGQIFNQSGQLVASVAQEGLVRRLQPKP
ncbi:MAG: acyl-CoA thioesterase II [Alphaproteobacteria bacterium]|nr:acyl-CoA thioesterase II [Alphaproteobacteria bacterium]|tara:strand:- start:105 stop:980 length:876 start_codon:yes stop_codon:yes gene_type:complete